MLWKTQITRILFVTNTVITIFSICTDQLVSSVRACEFGAMTESNISGTDRKKVINKINGKLKFLYIEKIDF